MPFFFLQRSIKFFKKTNTEVNVINEDLFSELLNSILKFISKLTWQSRKWGKSLLVTSYKRLSPSASFYVQSSIIKPSNKGSHSLPLAIPVSVCFRVVAPYQYKVTGQRRLLMNSCSKVLSITFPQNTFTNFQIHRKYINKIIEGNSLVTLTSYSVLIKSNNSETARGSE